MLLKWDYFKINILQINRENLKMLINNLYQLNKFINLFFIHKNISLKIDIPLI